MTTAGGLAVPVNGNAVVPAQGFAVKTEAKGSFCQSVRWNQVVNGINGNTSSRHILRPHLQVPEVHED